MGISIWQLLIILVIVVLLFGTKRLRNIGGDLGHALKSFKGAMSGTEQGRDEAADKQPDHLPPPASDRVSKTQAPDKDTRVRDEDKA